MNEEQRRELSKNRTTTSTTSPSPPSKETAIPDYSNNTTRLTASSYAWSATFTRGPLRYGNNPSNDCTGTYTTQPGATVGSLLAELTAWYAQSNGIPATDVVLIRYALREK